MFRRFLDFIARSSGYFTADDMEMCVRGAELAAIEAAALQHQNAPRETNEELNVPSSDGDDLPEHMIRYFVSYSHGNGYGCTELRANRPIKSFADIQRLCEVIGEKFNGQHDRPNHGIVILNWQRFETEEDDKSRETSPETREAAPVLRLIA